MKLSGHFNGYTQAELSKTSPNLDTHDADIFNQIFPIKSERGVLNIVRYSDIRCIRASGNYVEFQLQNHSLLHRGSLAQLLLQLPKYFIQVHRGYVVNVMHLKRLQSELGRYTECVLSDEKLVPIGKQYRDTLLHLLGVSCFEGNLSQKNNGLARV